MIPSHLVQALTALIPTRRPSFVWGPPGIGKSSIVSAAARKLGLAAIDLRAVLLDPIDLRGLPRIDKGVARWCPPEFLPVDGEGVLFLDELPQAMPSVQAACLQLSLDRRIGEYRLPDGWTIIAAGNRTEDRAGGHRLISPLLNRFVHLNLDISLDDWQDWAVHAGVPAEVRSFLRFRPGLLFQFEPRAGARAFPTPRSWEFVGQIIRCATRDLLLPMVAGCVGEGPAAEFVCFLQLCRELPDLDEVMREPATTLVPKEPAVLCALVGALVERCRTGDIPLLTRFVQYATRLPDEFAVLALRDTLAVQPKLVSLPAAQSWLKMARKRGVFFTA